MLNSTVAPNQTAIVVVAAVRHARLVIVEAVVVGLIGVRPVAVMIEIAVAVVAVSVAVVADSDRLRQAIIDADPGSTITFAIPGAGPHTIATTAARCALSSAGSGLPRGSSVGAACKPRAT